MLSIYGKKQKFCDGVSRRSFLKIGGFALGSLGGVPLADILQAQDSSGNRSSHKGLINIFLGGGPPHQDMWEIKTEAPVEIRGEFKPISTKVPDIQIGECFPKIAAMMDKFVAIRSVTGCAGGHDAYQCLTGWNRGSFSSIGGMPSIGSAVAKVKGSVDSSIPATVGLAAKTKHAPWSESGQAGFLGDAYQPFKPNGKMMADLKLNGITLDRLADRKSLLNSLGNLKRDFENVHNMNSFSQEAFGVLTSSRLVDALDLSKEDPKIVKKYGDGKPYQYQYDGAPTCNDHLLMARRLIEAGVQSVSLSYGRWDSHGKNFDLVRDHGAKLDQCLTALVEDLQERGMLDDVTVIVWGEFGRTPKINKGAGRDHWPQVSCALMAGGGMKTGQAIGATNRLGEFATKRPVSVQEIIATLYHNLGVDPMSTTLVDPTGRPQYLLDHRKPLPELV
jgi:hypothetical protein